ncbi:hypothetical protein, partial [Pseudomonas syringae group genomosp. 7]|uniref:hypothetical protein n=1 Tax=Pseudomonas syringae group genomosp. 7 TaxID=251699 RepID=UPI0037702B72
MFVLILHGYLALGEAGKQVSGAGSLFVLFFWVSGGFLGGGRPGLGGGGQGKGRPQQRRRRGGRRDPVAQGRG